MVDEFLNKLTGVENKWEEQMVKNRQESLLNVIYYEQTLPSLFEKLESMPGMDGM